MYWTDILRLSLMADIRQLQYLIVLIILLWHSSFSYLYIKCKISLHESIFKYGNDHEWLNRFGTLSLWTAGSTYNYYYCGGRVFLVVVKAAWYELNIPDGSLTLLLFFLCLFYSHFRDFLVDTNTHLIWIKIAT